MEAGWPRDRGGGEVAGASLQPNILFVFRSRKRSQFFKNGFLGKGGVLRRVGGQGIGGGGLTWGIANIKGFSLSSEAGNARNFSKMVFGTLCGTPAEATLVPQRGARFVRPSVFLLTIYGGGGALVIMWGWSISLRRHVGVPAPQALLYCFCYRLGPCPGSVAAPVPAPAGWTPPVSPSSCRRVAFSLGLGPHVRASPRSEF